MNMPAAVTCKLHRIPESRRSSGLVLPLTLAFMIGAFTRPASAGDVYCSDLTAVSATSGWSTVQKDLSIDQKPIRLGGKVYAKGLGTHAPSEIVYNLDGKYASFSAVVGIDDAAAGKGSSEFQVYADDSLLFKTGVRKSLMDPVTIAVSVSGRKKLRLVTTIGGDTYDMDDADWGGAMLAEKPTVSLARPGGSPAGRHAGFGTIVGSDFGNGTGNTPGARPTGGFQLPVYGFAANGSRRLMSLSDNGVRWTTAFPEPAATPPVR